MKKLITLAASSFFLLASTTQMTAQTCCSGSTVAPEVTSGFYTVGKVDGTSNTPAPVLSVTASMDLPTTEYIVTKRGTLAIDGMGAPDTTGGGGDVILGADADGIFMPNNMARYGVSLANGDTFDITAVGYDLAVIQELADSLLNGKNANGTACCELFVLMAAFINEPAIAGFCDSMNNAGIFSSADIAGMNEVLEIFDVFTEGSMSIGNITNTLALINQNGNFISPECGGTGAGDFLSYGIDRSAKYGYEAGNTIAVRELSDVSVFMLFPNPANTEAVNLYFTTKKTVDLTINLVDATGRTVYQAAANGVLGDISTTIPVSDLAPGLYIVELTDGYSNKTQKLIVR
ncbi:MAG: T9SS type A sorting domain-containing protein [Aureispira sp.]